jgi:cytochrome c-type biogenesis protein CcmH
VTALLALLAALVVVPAPAGAGVPTDREIDAVAGQLRCVVCQSLSVADSPSDMARQMRDVVRERLAAGETPDQVKAYFAERYGEWVLLSPPARGFGLLAWTLPLGALAGGIVAAVLVLRRWSVRGAPGGEGDTGEVDEDVLRAVREEVDRRAR